MDSNACGHPPPWPLLVLWLGACVEPSTPAPAVDAGPDAAAPCADDPLGVGTPDLPAATVGFETVTDLVVCEPEGDWFALDAPLGVAVAATVQADRPVVLVLRGADDVVAEGRAPLVQARVPADGLVVGIRSALPGPPVRYALRVGLAPRDCGAPTTRRDGQVEGVVCADEVEAFSLDGPLGSENALNIEVLGGDGVRVALVSPHDERVQLDAIEVRDRGTVRYLQPDPVQGVRVHALGFGAGFRVTQTVVADAATTATVSARLDLEQQVVTLEGGRPAELVADGVVVEVRHTPSGLVAGVAVTDDDALRVAVAGPPGPYTLAVRAQVVGGGWSVEAGPPGAGPWTEVLASFELPADSVRLEPVAPTGATAGAVHIALTAAEALRRVPWEETRRPRFDWRPGARPTCGSCFHPETGHIELSGAPGDEDEWDDSVILHELGHALARRDDSPGGRHDGSRTWPVLAWSEGFAHFFASWAQGGPVLGDQRPAGYQVVDLETIEDPRAYGTEGGLIDGDVSELLVAGLLWDVLDPGAEDPVEVPADVVLPLLTLALAEWTDDAGAPGLDLADALNALAEAAPEADLAALAAAWDYPWP